MCQFIETIRAEAGRYERLGYHNARMNSTGRHFFVGWGDVDLHTELPVPPDEGMRWKVRVVYGRNGIEDIGFAPYCLRPIRSLRLVYDNEIDYTYKSVCRSRFDDLTKGGGVDEDILIVRNGLLTDTSFTNVALWNGIEWHTPAHPLLRGTMREHLIGLGTIVPCDIHESCLSDYSRICLFNALIDFGQLVLDVSDVIR